jgi:hypothetical protein
MKYETNDDFTNFPTRGEHEGTQNPEWKEYLSIPQLSPTKQALPAIVRVLPFPVYSRARHFIRHGVKPTYLDCSSRHPDFNGKCVGCYYSEKDSKVYGFSQESFVFTVLDMRLYHVVETDNETSKSVCQKNIGAGVPCQLCERGNKPRIVGKRHWTLGSGYFRTLKQTNLELGTKCANCGGVIVTTNIVCPKCKADIVSPDYLAKTLPIDAAMRVASTNKCGRCGTVLKPKDLLQTLHCTGCQNPVRGSIYKCDLELSIIVDDGNKGGQRVLKIIPRAFAPLGEQFAELAKPYDFQRIFKPMSLDRQAMMLKVINPFADKQAYTIPYTPPVAGQTEGRKEFIPETGVQKWSANDDDTDVFDG